MSLGERTGRAGSTSWSPPIWIGFGCLFFKILAESVHLLLFIVMLKLLLRLSQSLRSSARDIESVGHENSKGGLSQTQNMDQVLKQCLCPAKYRNVCLHALMHMGIGQVC